MVVVATIAEGAHEASISGYREHSKGTMKKELIKPISARYNENFDDPFL
jgi:hypothetical protein